MWATVLALGTWACSVGADGLFGAGPLRDRPPAGQASRGALEPAFAAGLPPEPSAGVLRPTASPAARIAGVVSSASKPNEPGLGVSAAWQFGRFLGTPAGNAMCKVVGGHHACSYEEVRAAEQAGELAGLANQTFWVSRMSEVVTVDGTTSPPGPGGRCNDWTHADGCHGLDGEYGVIAGGAVSYVFDPDTAFDGGVTNHANGIGCLASRNILCCHAP